MKKIFTILVALVALVGVTNAQVTEETMVIHALGQEIELPVSYIDSITFLFPGQGGEEKDYPAIKWTELVFMGMSANEPISDKTYTVNVGFDATCVLYPGVYYLLSEGLSADPKTGALSGTGYLATLEMPTYVITAPANYAGYGVTTSEYFVEAREAIESYDDPSSCALQGKILNFQDYATFTDQFYWSGTLTQASPDFATLAGKYTASTEGTFIQYVENGQRYIPEAMIKEAYIVSYDFTGDDVDEFQYVIEVEWLGGFYGLKLNGPATEAETDVVRPYELDIYGTNQYAETEYLDAMSAPAAKKAARTQTKGLEVKTMKEVGAFIKANPVEVKVKK